MGMFDWLKPKSVEKEDNTIHTGVTTAPVVAVVGRTKSNPTKKDIDGIMHKIGMINKYLTRVDNGDFDHKDQAKIANKVIDLKRDKRRLEATLNLYKETMENK